MPGGADPPPGNKMKKINIILLGILTVLVAGCAKDTSIDVPGNNWVQDLTLPVPVEFGTPMMADGTKAAIRNLNDMHNRYFGFFAVNKNAADLREYDGLGMRNQNTRYDIEKGFRFGYPSEDRKIYYPSNFHADYDFYAYYTFTKDNNVEVLPVVGTATKISVGMFVAKNSDVLYGYATTGAGKDGYNADYVRRTSNKPVLAFTHPTSGLSFDIVTDQASVPIADNDSLMLGTLTFKNLADSVSLCIIDKENPANNGKFEAHRRRNKKLMNGDTGNLRASFYVNAPADGYLGVADTLERNLGDDIFIMPQEEPIEATAVFILKTVHVSPDNGNTVVAEYDTFEQDIVLDPAEFGVSGGYKAGYMYNYRLVVSYKPDEETGELKPKVRVEADR